MLHTKFRENRPAGFRLEDFLTVFTIYGRGGHLGQVTRSHQIFISLYLKAFIQNLVQIGTLVSEKIQFEFLYVHNLGQRSKKMAAYFDFCAGYFFWALNQGFPSGFFFKGTHVPLHR